MNRNCPCCNHGLKIPFYTTAISQNIVECLKCGMVYAVNTPVVDYSTDSIYASSTYDAQKEHYYTIVRNILPHVVTRTGRTLDVGCATGGLIQAFQDHGFADVTGLSLSKEEVAFCENQGLKAFVGDVCDPNLKPSIPYDLITLTHVLEHVPDVQGFLAHLKDWVSPRGFLYIEVPDAKNYVDYFTSICQGFNTEHINHFDLSHLIIACGGLGMQVYTQGAYIVTTEGNRPYPVIWVLFRPHNHDLRLSIEKYAEKLDGQLEGLRAHLKEEFEGVGEFALWGLGQTTRLLLSRGFLPERAKVLWATDTNDVFHGRPCGEIIVTSPTNFKPPSHVPILVCSQLSAQAVVSRIKELGLTNRIILLDSSNNNKEI